MHYSNLEFCLKLTSVSDCPCLLSYQSFLTFVPDLIILKPLLEDKLSGWYLTSASICSECVKECLQTGQGQEWRNYFSHTLTIWSATYEQEEVFNTNHRTENIKQTPTQASSRGRRAYSTSTARAYLCVSAWLLFNNRSGRKTSFRPHWSTWQLSSGYLECGGCCPHDGRAKQAVQDEDIPAFTVRRRWWIWSLSCFIKPSSASRLHQNRKWQQQQ